MKDFVRAALPFVLAGIAVIILCVGNQKKLEAENAKAQESRLAFGMLLGLALGAALDGCGVFESPMIGLTLGPLWGMALSTLGASGKSAPKNEKHIKSGGTTPCNTKKN